MDNMQPTEEVRSPGPGPSADADTDVPEGALPYAVRSAPLAAAWTMSAPPLFSEFRQGLHANLEGVS